jgi:hypothetical protein
VSNYMQLYSRIVVDLLVILAKTPVNFTGKTDQIRLGGGHGGAYPL